MPTLRITNGFDKLSESNFAGRTNAIAFAIGQNPEIFVDPSPSLAEYEAARKGFEDAMIAAANGGRYEKALKDTARAALEKLTHRLASYVLFVANGNEDIALASGFSIAKERENAAPMKGVDNPTATDGLNPGEIRYSFDKVPGARAYVYQCTPDPVTANSNWHTQVGTVRKTLFKGLDSGKRYWFRVVAIGKNGQGIYSNPVSRVSQ